MTVLDGEPELDVHDIQGHVYPGFGSQHSAVVAYRLDDPAKGLIGLRSLVPEVTSMAAALRDKEARRASLKANLGLPPQPVLSLALAFSSTALRAWSRSATGQDLHFREGMRVDAEALGDVIDGDRKPVDWILGQDDNHRIDMLLVAGHSSDDTLAAAVDRWTDMLGTPWRELRRDFGRRRPSDKEFFGFNDGISQPAIRGLSPGGVPVSPRFIANDEADAKEFARPGQRLVWPGNFIFGYPREVSDPLRPGSEMLPPEPWMRNGSYLVVRRLRQDVEAFSNAVSRLKAHLAGLGEEVTQDWAASRLVGRWPDGTPLILSPDEANPGIGGDRNRNNYFTYQSVTPSIKVHDGKGNEAEVPGSPADPLGRLVPLVAHIRQINPREGRSEIGPGHHPGKLMLRRGVTFGREVEDDPAADRGLMFLSYQTSISEQFRFLQVTWANSETNPRPNIARDAIIGQDGTIAPQRDVRFRAPSGVEVTCPFHGRWVISTGGAYLFAPSIETMRDLTGLSAVTVASVSPPQEALTAIRGIGPAFEQRLGKAGISSVAQIAAWTSEDVERIGTELKIGGRIVSDEWVAQARRLMEQV